MPTHLLYGDMNQLDWTGRDFGERECSLRNQDQVVAEIPVEHNRVRVDISAAALTQVVFTPLQLDRITRLSLNENTFTPGSLMTSIFGNRLKSDF